MSLLPQLRATLSLREINRKLHRRLLQFRMMNSSVMQLQLPGGAHELHVVGERSAVSSD